MSLSTLGATFSEVEDFIREQIPWNRRQDPEWLKPLLGDSPLLSLSEYKFISEVRNSITEEVKSSRQNAPSSLKKKLSVMKDNFDEVVKYLKENSRNKNYFLRNYPPWELCRDGSISQLKYIAMFVDEKNKESAAIRATGSTVSLAGGLLSLVSGLGLLRVAGGVLMGLGSLAALGASVVEFQELKEKIKEAEQIMLKDRELSERLWNWMSEISHIHEAYDAILSVDMNLTKIAQDLYVCYKKNRSLDHMNASIGKAKATLKKLDWMPDDVKKTIEILLSIFILHDRYHSLFNVALESYKFKRALSTVYNVATEAVKMISVVNASKNSKINPFKKYRLGIGIALDVISIINATKDFDETSKEVIAIAEAAKKLEDEAEVFKKLYTVVLDESA